MSLSGFLPAVSRRAVAMGTVAALAGIVSVVALKAQATSAPPQSGQAPAAAQAPAAGDPFVFTTPEPRLVLLSLTADAGAAMEAAVAKAKESLAKPGAKPEQKQQAAHWKVYKSVETNGDISIFFMLDQTVPNATYNPFKPVYDDITAAGGDRKEIDALFARVAVAGGIKGLKVFPITTLADMAGGGGH
jgi:hypothetical protein